GARPTRYRDILDGTSNTLCVGEAVPAWCKKTWWYWFDGSTATAAIPLNYKPDGEEPNREVTDWQRTYSFMSRHTGGGNFCLGDGSVRFISDGIDLHLYRDLANMASGKLAMVP